VIARDSYGPGRGNQQAILLGLRAPDVEVLGITVESGDGRQEEISPKPYACSSWSKGPRFTSSRAPYHPPEIVPPLREGAPVRKRGRLPCARDPRAPRVGVHPRDGSAHQSGAGGPRLDDRFAGRMRELVVMGGSFNPRPANNAFAGEYAHSVRLEFNFRLAPEAARIVLRSAWPRIVQVRIDPTTRPSFVPNSSSASPPPTPRWPAT